MEFYRLSAAFYKKYNQCENILNKEERPYYMLLLELNNLSYAIPLRSYITQSYCFITGDSNGQKNGFDYSKREIRRRQKNSSLFVSVLCRFSSLRYFHGGLGLN
jgi:protein AbiQ